MVYTFCNKKDGRKTIKDVGDCQYVEHIDQSLYTFCNRYRYIKKIYVFDQSVIEFYSRVHFIDVIYKKFFFSMLPKEKYIINIPPAKIQFKLCFSKNFSFQFCHKQNTTRRCKFRSSCSASFFAVIFFPKFKNNCF